MDSRVGRRRRDRYSVAFGVPSLQGNIFFFKLVNIGNEVD